MTPPIKAQLSDPDLPIEVPAVLEDEQDDDALAEMFQKKRTTKRRLRGEAKEG